MILYPHFYELGSRVLICSNMIFYCNKSKTAVVLSRTGTICHISEFWYVISLLTTSCGKVAHGCFENYSARSPLNRTPTNTILSIGHTKLANGKVVMAGLQHPCHKQSCSNRADFHVQIQYHHQMSRTSVADLRGDIKRGMKYLVGWISGL